MLVPGEPNVSYICSRYYRAPELIFGATDYTIMIGPCGSVPRQRWCVCLHACLLWGIFGPMNRVGE